MTQCKWRYIFSVDTWIRSQIIPNEMIKIVVAKDRSDGYKWECRRQINGKWHKVEMSIRKDSWVEKSNLSLEEIVKLTYWWCRGLKQDEIHHEVNISEHTAVDWDSFYRSYTFRKKKRKSVVQERQSKLTKVSLERGSTTGDIRLKVSG